MLRSWRLWLPLGLLLVGFVLALLIYNLPVDLQAWAALYLQLFFVPQGLFLYLIGGALAPRASYLIGGLLGVTSGVMYGIALVVTLPTDTDSVVRAGIESVALSSPVMGAILGFLAGGLAGLVRYLIAALLRHETTSRSWSAYLLAMVGTAFAAWLVMPLILAVLVGIGVGLALAVRDRPQRTLTATDGESASPPLGPVQIGPVVGYVPCPQCASLVPIKARRCPQCDTGLSPCEDCGGLIPYSEMVCRYCGAEYFDDGT
jgi:hypothetical protein